MKKCQTCNDYFEELGEWQKLCKPCYAKFKRAEKARSDELDTELAKLSMRNSVLTQRIYELEKRAEKSWPDEPDIERLLYLNNERAKMLHEERARADKLENEKEKLTIQISALNWRIFTLEGQIYVLKKKNENTVFTKDFIKKIRLLTHPDKHNNSELSLNVSKTLNGLIKRAQS